MGKLSFLTAWLVLGLLSSLCAQDAPKKPWLGGSRTVIPKEVQSGLESHLDVVYARYGERELSLDLYRPKSDEKLPAVVCIHGGGWWRGDRESHAPLAQALAAKGYVTVTISYRFSGELPFPAQIEDCKAAVRFLRAEAETYGIDPERIGATGLSAGGHLTALLATSGGVEELEGSGGNASESSRIQAAVPMAAQTNFRSHFGNIKRTPPPAPGEKPDIWVQFLDGTPEEVPERYLLASPLTHLDASDPPIHLVTGGDDAVSTHAEVFRARMRELGLEEGLTIIPDAPHAFLAWQNFFDQMLEASTAWFDEHLKGD